MRTRSYQNIFLKVNFNQPAFTCSKLTIKTLKQRCEIFHIFHIFQLFEHISHLRSSVSIVNFKHVIAGWVGITELFFSNCHRSWNSKIQAFSGLNNYREIICVRIYFCKVVSYQQNLAMFKDFPNFDNTWTATSDMILLMVPLYPL